MELKFYRCRHCGKIIFMVNETGVDTMCCGEAMTEIKAGSMDASVEKHVPVIEREEDKVKVTIGSVAHPMAEEHYIEWVACETSRGVQVKYLHPGEEPHIGFKICCCEELKNVYAYCNLHGLWKA